MITNIRNKEDYFKAVERLEVLSKAASGSEEAEEYAAIVLSMKIYNIEKYEGSEISSLNSEGLISVL